MPFKSPSRALHAAMLWDVKPVSEKEGDTLQANKRMLAYVQAVAVAGDDDQLVVEQFAFSSPWSATLGRRSRAGFACLTSCLSLPTPGNFKHALRNRAKSNPV